MVDVVQSVWGKIIMANIFQDSVFYFILSVLASGTCIVQYQS